MNCPECDAELNIAADAMVGEIISCPDCGESWEYSLSTQDIFGLKKAETEGEDWGQ